MVRPTIIVSSLYGSPNILVSANIRFIQKFEGGLTKALNDLGVGMIWRFSTFKPLYLRNVQDTTKITIDH